MAVTDPIADYLTRIRNALKAKHRKVDIPASNLKREITKVLQEEGYIRNFVEIEDGKQGLLRVYLKYDAREVPAITGLKRVSKPGRRVYVPADKVPRVMNNLGIAILSTSRGVITHKQALREHIGGEVLCYVW
ncbi:MAG: 30S ribosomal protein S8 [Calditrichaeota bacterium]|nr:30S ribosomal protein S8 [Calditrichota bacterium]